MASVRTRSLILSVLILLVAGGLVALMVLLRPKAAQEERELLLLTVEAVEIKPENVRVPLPSQGLVTPQRTTTLTAEVAGRVASMSPRFRVGERFAEGEEMARLDDTDYQAALAQAKSSLEEARVALLTEQVRGEQATRDWQKLGKAQPASDLVLRKPQLASAQALLKAAERAVDKAERDVQRTRLTAPYACRVTQQQVELGAYVNPGSAMAMVSSVGLYEVRLALSVNDLPFLNEDPTAVAGLPVLLHADIAGKRMEWKAQVVRAEGEIERSSRSFYVVAQLDEATDDSGLLQAGLFVNATLEGVELQNILRLPRRAFLDANRVVVVDEQDRLQFRQVSVKRTQPAEIWVTEGLQPGDRICLTVLSAPIEGTQVRVLQAMNAPAS